MSNQFFQKKVDRRSRSAMVDFLKSHHRYNTMSSWNRSSSYAHCIKIHRLSLTSEQSDKAYEMLDTDFWDEIRWPIDDFTDSQGGCYTIGTNGRSGGYLVLYQSCRELTGHLSYCPSCGQRNFKKVPPTFEDANENVIAQEILRSLKSWLPDVYLSQPAIEALPLSIDEKLSLIVRIKSQLVNCSVTDACGVCRKPRRNFDVLPSQLSVYPGKSIDQDEDFYAEDWLMAGSRYFCESFYEHPCSTSGKNYATANACGGPSRPGHSIATQQGVAHMLSNDSTRFRKACIFTSQAA